ncbi:MAG: potassium channel family protein, partial [Fusobacteriaceae bacterium]
KNLLIKDGPAKAIILIFYYIIFLPVLNHVFKDLIFLPENTFVLKIVAIINIIFLILCHIVLFRYSFTDVIKKKRKVRTKDIIITFSIYVTIALSFGFVYLIIGFMSDVPVLSGIDYEKRGLYFYFKHIYFSFITITSVGYGDIYPLTFLAQLAVMIEVVLGIALLNFTLGITLSSGILNFSTANTEEEKQNNVNEGLDEMVEKTMKKTFRSVKKISGIKKWKTD